MEKDNISKIKDAAINLFSQRGYKETKIADIAKSAGVSVGTIYVSFKGKKELFKSLKIPEVGNYRPKYNKRRSEILKIALSLLSRNGYSDTSMNQIALECGYSKAILYQYFKSKEELFSAIFEETTIISSLDNIEIKCTNENLEETFKKMGYIFMKMFENEDRLNLIRVVIAELPKFPQLESIMCDCGINKVTEKFSKYLKELSERGIINCSNPQITARSYFGLLYSFIITGKVINQMKNEFSDDEIVSYATQLFVNFLQRNN
ncbi:TetR/AcrR family transcriptional regulator [Clostridium beijerinckii]|uniref:HTH-type transcriptional regulator AcrR n=1 Tax=Clostridium beijerinckii TaxID=1520 RepID=A0A1S8RZ30_CLOBE|nr:TetR/AcrR family transcriptional regulator [Clostridium beijerinckii]NRY61538.1 AcrR family transcriptional regulator [Clostridium beijerinckii]OOM58463.1 HTH-type transcriptional regulator AcrR [Clostridium beijerinckii]